MGLQWSYETPFSTKYGQQSQFDPEATDPLTGRRGAIVHGKGNLANRDLNNCQPRLGLAWNFRPRAVFPSSFGMYTVDLMTNSAGQNFEEYNATANVQQLPGDPRHAFLLSQGPAQVRFNTAADGSVPFQGTNYSGRNASYFDPKMRMPYVSMWSAGFQVQLSKTWVGEVIYQGSSGVGLLNNWDMNVVPLDISTNPTVLNQVFAAVQNYKPFTQFGAIQGMVRPNAVQPAEQMVVDDYTVGSRFPLASQNSYFNVGALAYPSAFTAGTMGRNVVESPGLQWTQLSLSKTIAVKERLRFTVRWDCNNPTKQPQLADPGGSYNLQALAQFGRFNGIGRGSFSDIGPARMHHVIVGRFEW